MTALRVYMMDLMAFVRKQGRIWAILPDARYVAPDDPCKCDEHYPIVLFDAPAQADNEWPIIRNLLKIKENINDKNAWLLKEEDLIIPIQAAAKPIIAKESSPGQYPVPVDARLFSWVPRMREVLDDCGDIDSNLVPNDPMDDLPTSAVARMLLAQGTLETATFVKFVDNQGVERIVTFNFKDGGTSSFAQERALAETLIATIPLDRNEITIRAWSHVSKTYRDMTLTAVQGQPFINILVANMSALKDISAQKDGSHFNLYYRISSRPRLLGPIPVDISQAVVSGVELDLPAFMQRILEQFIGGNSRPICTLVQLDA